MARRMPYGTAAGPGNTQPGAAMAPGMGGNMAPRRAPMTMAPAGGNKPPAPVQPPPPPIQPNAGGPTSPMNIGSMLHAQMGNEGNPAGGMAPQGPPPREPLPPWGSSQGDPMAMTPDAQADGGQVDSLNTDQSMSPLVHLRMLKAMGRI